MLEAGQLPPVAVDPDEVGGAGQHVGRERGAIAQRPPDRAVRQAGQVDDLEAVFPETAADVGQQHPGTADPEAPRIALDPDAEIPHLGERDGRLAPEGRGVLRAVEARGAPGQRRAGQGAAGAPALRLRPADGQAQARGDQGADQEHREPVLEAGDRPHRERRRGRGGGERQADDDRRTAAAVDQRQRQQQERRPYEEAAGELGRPHRVEDPQRVGRRQEQRPQRVGDPFDRLGAGLGHQPFAGREVARVGEGDAGVVDDPGAEQQRVPDEQRHGREGRRRSSPASGFRIHSGGSVPGARLAVKMTA
jgi:hypothetical protein